PRNASHGREIRIASTKPTDGIPWGHSSVPRTMKCRRSGARGQCEAIAMETNGHATEVKAPLTPERVFREHGARVYNLARRMLGNDADAEDVTQDVLLQVLRKGDTFRGESAFPTWLHRVTVNAALANRMQRSRRNEHEHADPLAMFGEDGHHT